MIDIDSTLDISHLEFKLQYYGLTARIYRTYKGYHLFITSHPIYHKSDLAWELMDNLNCDLYYMFFSYLNGFKVRLNPKSRDDEQIAAEYIITIESVPEDPHLLQLLGLHDSLIIKQEKFMLKM